jgi:hypothetical protein
MSTTDDEFYKIDAIPSSRFDSTTNRINLNYGDNFYDSDVKQYGFIQKINSIDVSNLSQFPDLTFAFNTKGANWSSRKAACTLLNQAKKTACHPASQLAPKDDRCIAGEPDSVKKIKHNNIMNCRNLRALELNSTCAFFNPQDNLYYPNNINKVIYRTHAEQIPLEEMSASECLYTTDNTANGSNPSDLREARRSLQHGFDFTDSSMPDESGIQQMDVDDTNLFMRALVNTSKTRIPTININQTDDIIGNFQRPIHIRNSGKLDEFRQNIQRQLDQQAKIEAEEAEQIRRLEKSHKKIYHADLAAVTDVFKGILDDKLTVITKLKKMTQKKRESAINDILKELEGSKNNFLVMFYIVFIHKMYNKILTIKQLILRYNIDSTEENKTQIKNNIKFFNKPLKDLLFSELEKYLETHQIKPNLIPSLELDFNPFYTKKFQYKNELFDSVEEEKKEFKYNAALFDVYPPPSDASTEATLFSGSPPGAASAAGGSHHAASAAGGSHHAASAAAAPTDQFDINDLEVMIKDLKEDLNKHLKHSSKKGVKKSNIKRMRYKKGKFKSRKQSKLIKRSRTKNHNIS